MINGCFYFFIENDLPRPELITKLLTQKAVLDPVSFITNGTPPADEKIPKSKISFDYMEEPFFGKNGSLYPGVHVVFIQ